MLIVLVILGLVGSGVTTVSRAPGAIASSPAVDETRTLPADPTDVRAATQLAEYEGLEFDQALTRIERQAELEDLALVMTQSRPETAAGAYIDHENGGRLIVLDTDPESARAAVPDHMTDIASVIAADWSTNELLTFASNVRRESRPCRWRLAYYL